MFAQVSHMMRRVRLNFYRAEDEMYVLRRRQWRVSTTTFCDGKY